MSYLIKHNKCMLRDENTDNFVSNLVCLCKGK